MLKLATKFAIALWVAKGITGLMGNSTEGLSSQALQQGGIGLLLTTLIITMPTVAAALWQGSMGKFMAYSAFGTAGASSAAPGPQGQPPGSYVPQHGGSNTSTPETSRQMPSGHNYSGSLQTSTPQEGSGSRGAANNNSRFT
ncbi:hypothetical protein [Xanthomonas sp. 4461]|uniref:hypothetical protein n=1 Tax=Xanthomonas sp. 4461 TaxID=3035313 RepID=UPI0023EA2D74|nr:hypothetical protein [Xanthomonas sp. 4461]MCS3810062.1 hypothetical protein [Xanthomonas sp. 4461]